jgi:branched-chain amino acid transport system substrate-binding protein
MKTMRWTKAVLASSAVITLGITGCSSGASSQTSENGNKVLTVGLSVPQSGPIASAGSGQACGFEAYFKAVADGGGINGYEFEAKKVDNQYDPATAATVARDFVSDGAFAVYVTGTATTDASRPALHAAGVPLFGTGDGAAYAPPKAPADFGFYPRYVDDLTTAVDFLVNELNKKKISFVNVGGGPGAATTAAFAETVKKSGAEVGVNPSIPANTTDYSAFAQQLKEANADAVYAQVTDTMLSNLQKAAHAIGYNPAWMVAPFGYGPAYHRLAGDLADGVYVTQWFHPTVDTENEAVQKYLKDVEALGGKCAEEASDPNVGIGYNIAAIMAYGLEQATKDGGEPTSESLVEALQLDRQGLGTAESLTYSEDSHAAISSAAYYQVQGGTLKQVGTWRPLITGKG